MALNLVATYFSRHGVLAPKDGAIGQSPNTLLHQIPLGSRWVPDIVWAFLTDPAGQMRSLPLALLEEESWFREGTWFVPGHIENGCVAWVFQIPDPQEQILPHRLLWKSHPMP